jgi:aspartate/methionine/tyrosine aminotransferase
MYHSGSITMMGYITPLAHSSRAYPNRLQAALAMLNELSGMGIYKTPDGAPYSASAIRASMVDM